MKRILLIPVLTLSCFLLIGCSNGLPDSPINKARAVLQPTEGNNLSGTITFTREAAGLRVVADVNGLTPGLHGFHVHQYGDCSAPDASSAGDHYSKRGMEHGSSHSEHRHIGDLPNIVADEEGHGSLNTVVQLNLEGTEHILGRGVIVHEGEDDYEDKASAGARVGCGVIGVVQD